MILFLFGFLAGVIVTAFAAFLIVGNFLSGMQRGLGRALGWRP